MATKIPEGPWTEERLGKELYETLAVEYGCCTPDAGFRPGLDLTDPYNEQQAKATKPAKAATDKE